MHKLKKMQECLISCVWEQMKDLSKTDAKELGEVMDMIKDLSETMYYEAITKAMEEKEEEKEHSSEKHCCGEHARDHREGRSPMCRKSYLEAKEKQYAKEHQMKELESYLLELSQDINEMIQEASMEEKQMLQQKLSMLASKIK